MNPSRTPDGSRWTNFTRALRSRNYRLFFIGQGVSLIGTWMQRTALLWLVASWYHDEGVAALWLGIVGFAGQIPAFVFTPLAGALADRWNRHRMVIGTQVLAMVQAFLLAGLTLSNTLTMWHVIALSVWLGSVNAVDIPARQAFMKEMIDRPEDLNNAIALNSSIVNLGRLIGPTLGGLIAALASPGICFLVNAFSFLAVIAAMLMMRLAPRETVPHRTHLVHNLIEGVRYAFASPPIRSLLFLMALVSLVGIPYASLLPVFAKHALDCGPRGYGALVAAAGTGALAGALYLASRASVLGLGRLIAAAPFMLGLSLVLFAWSGSLYLSMALLAIAGLGQMLLMASGNTVLQTIADDDKRGRIMSFYSLSFMGMVPLGNLLAGVAARHFGISWTVTAGGALCILGAAAFWAKLPELRAHVHPIYVSKGIIPEVVRGVQAADQTVQLAAPAAIAMDDEDDRPENGSASIPQF